MLPTTLLPTFVLVEAPPPSGLPSWVEIWSPLLSTFVFSEAPPPSGLPSWVGFLKPLLSTFLIREAPPWLGLPSWVHSWAFPPLKLLILDFPPPN